MTPFLVFARTPPMTCFLSQLTDGYTRDFLFLLRFLMVMIVFSVVICFPMSYQLMFLSRKHFSVGFTAFLSSSVISWELGAFQKITVAIETLTTAESAAVVAAADGAAEEEEGEEGVGGVEEEEGEEVIASCTAQSFVVHM